MSYKKTYFDLCFVTSVPSPKIYVQVNPVQINLDPLSILWLNAFGRNLQEALQPQSNPTTYIDVHLESIMPRVSFCYFRAIFMGVTLVMNFILHSSSIS